jgi:septum formation protein
VTTHIVLASGSAIRRQILANAGVTFETSVARIDEDSVKSALLSEGASPRDIADALAEMKAARVSVRLSGAWVIGSDQVLDCDGQLFSKPANMAEARAQLLALRGRTHRLLSAAVIVKDGTPQWRHVGIARLTMREFSETYLDDYLARLGDGALATVGGYKLEEEGVRLFSRIEGDYFTVLGMPLIELLGYLTSRGVLPG